MKHITTLILLLLSSAAIAQQLPFPESAANDRAALATAIPELAKRVLIELKNDNPDTFLADQFRMQIAVGQYEQGVNTLNAWSGQHTLLPGQLFDNTILLEIYAKAKLRANRDRSDWRDAFEKTTTEVFARLDDNAAIAAESYLATSAATYQARLVRSLTAQKGKSDISLSATIELIRNYLSVEASQAIAPGLTTALSEDDARRYEIDNDVIIKTLDGITLSAVVARKRGATIPLPASFMLNIYTDLAWNRREAKIAALHGYVGVIVDSRGKRLSLDTPRPWETEAEDSYGVIDWISRQSWSNGKVGMYGTSYSGFAAWAATKRLHPALKTIVPVSASQPGFGLPMQDNVFQFANYAWPFYVTNNRYLDYELYNDSARWSGLARKWYASGRRYREIDAIDGLRNPLLQKQLQHPSFDQYWQAMQPYRREYARISIPVLSMTGYFDDANASAVNYLQEHYKYYPRAEHYLVIGPYGHSEAHRDVKRKIVNGYTLDPAAQFDGIALLYQWFDYVMRAGPRPALLKDKINYQTMGANEWRHAPSIAAMSTQSLKLYLDNAKVGEHFALSRNQPKSAYLEQRVDFSDRTTESSLYASDAIETQFDFGANFQFVSEPFEAPTSIDGIITGQLWATINKKDMDVTLAFYEQMPDGRYFRLSYYLGRASYARDQVRRNLLTPDKKTSIPFKHTALISRQMAKGSRLVVLVTVNKTAWAQLNEGSGKDVSDESIDDAKVPLVVQWHNDSYIQFPIRATAGQ